MGNTLAICRKELRGYLVMPIGRVLLASAAIAFGFAVYGAGDDGWRRAAAPVFALSDFRPGREMLSHRVLLVVGLARVLAMFLIPMIAMRLFPEERQARTIELLLTSPVREMEIVWGKWLAAWILYVVLIGVGALEFVVRFREETDWSTMLVCYAALSVIGAGVMAAGEWISMFSKHQLVPAAGTLAVAWCVLRICNSGVLSLASLGLCLALLVGGWAGACWTVKALREG